MPYQANILQVLLSSPSDLPPQHREIITNAMHMWNATTGRMSKIHFAATDWKIGVSPTFGMHPQQIINETIVDSSDLAIVVFSGKLGTQTENFESGTVEEIERLAQAGKQVAVFVNRVPSISNGVHEAEEKLRLEKYLESIQTKCLYKQYSDTDELTQAINAFLQSIAFSHSTKFSSESKISDSKKLDMDNPSIGVWASITKESYQETDSKGRLRTKTKNLLNLENLTGVPVKNVRYQFFDSDGKPDELFDVISHGEPQPAGSLKPGGQSNFNVLQVLASSNSAVCRVYWESPNGEEFTTETEIFI